MGCARGPEDTQQTTTTPTSVEPDGFTPDPIEWDDCDQVECATLAVPLDYEEPDGEQIEIYAVRTPASGERIGALFTNPGGPGAGGAEFAEILPLLLPSAITEHFDIIGVDPRGVGGSEPVDWGWMPRSSTASTPASTARRTRPPCSTSAGGT